MEPNRKYRTTKEVAAAYNVQPQSVLAALCRHGHYLGLRPVMLPNRLLGWAVRAAALLNDNFDTQLGTAAMGSTGGALAR